VSQRLRCANGRSRPLAFPLANTAIFYKACLWVSVKAPHEMKTEPPWAYGVEKNSFKK
jgi:hypothetical protein